MSTTGNLLVHGRTGSGKSTHLSRLMDEARAEIWIIDPHNDHAARRPHAARYYGPYDLHAAAAALMMEGAKAPARGRIIVIDDLDHFLRYAGPVAPRAVEHLARLGARAEQPIAVYAAMGLIDLDGALRDAFTCGTVHPLSQEAYA